MENQCKIDENFRKQVVTLEKEGMTISVIIRNINRSKIAVSRILKLHEETSSLASQRRKTKENIEHKYSAKLYDSEVVIKTPFQYYSRNFLLSKS